MRIGPVLHALDAVQQGQRGALMPWSPVFLDLGIALYFALPWEPGVAVYLLAAGGVALGLAAQFGLWREWAGPLGLGLALLSAGVAVAGLRAHSVAGPVLEFRYYGPIEGRVVAIDRSASDALRITLDAVRLDDVRPAHVPRRVRIALHGPEVGVVPAPGMRVMTTGHLSPPSGAAEPGGFDFRRHAWFQSLGAVGYTRVPVLLTAGREGGAAPLFHLRMRLSDAIRAEIPGQPGAFAAAVLTGDRSGLALGSVEAMRDANIAHLLAISGLHMGLLTGFVFAALRLALALIPPLALRVPARKWAALGALLAGAFYLALSGGNVATERAFIQVGVMFCAVLLDRRAVTLRSVAIAALIVLLHRPETLFSPGFQMSFAATTALVAGFGALRGVEVLRGRPKWQGWLFALIVSSVVAGLATAPYAAAHFNRVAVYGLAANLLTVPVMGSLIIPMAVLAALLWPFGLAPVALSVMAPGLAWILGVAERVADLPGAVAGVVSPAPWTLGALTLGALWLILWQGRLRWLGAVPVLAALVLWPASPRPAILVSESGRLVGVMSAEGRALSRPRGDGFVAGIWLENDGDPADQSTAAARPFWRAPPGETGLTQGHWAEVAGLILWHGSGRRAAREASLACAHADLVILSERWPDDPPPPPLAMRPHATAPGAAEAAMRPPEARPPLRCQRLDAPLLSRTGAVALQIVEGSGAPQLAIAYTVRDTQGRRLWSPPAP